MPGPRLSAARFVLAAAVSLALVLGAPFIGQLRSSLRSAFPGYYVTIVLAAIGLAVAAGLIAALARIRERRGARYGALAAALGIAAAYAMWSATGNPEVDAVQRFHFVEYGLVTLLFYRAWRPMGDLAILILPVFAGLLVGTLEEWFQWFIPGRVGEVNDIFLNLVAIACGLLFSLAFDPPERLEPRVAPGSRRLIGAIAAIVLLAFAAFFHSVHLGHLIADEEIGTFGSRFTAARLAELAADRAARWRADPPVVFRRLSREDQYMTEGVSHVQRRNVAWTEGNAAAAWAENLILEKYYEPVLDTPSYISRAGHRWPAEQRADAERRAEGLVRVSYVSDAYPYRLFAWRRIPYWAIVGLAAAGLLWPWLAARGRAVPPRPSAAVH
jgi:VanZ family protein